MCRWELSIASRYGQSTLRLESVIQGWSLDTATNTEAILRNLLVTMHRFRHPDYKDSCAVAERSAWKIVTDEIRVITTVRYVEHVDKGGQC